MSGFISGSDLDALFMAYTSGTKAGATGFSVGAQDLADRFQPREGSTPVSNTGFVSGSDLASLFRNINLPLVTVTLSGDNITHNTTNMKTAGVRVNSGGTMDERVGASWSQISTSTDWIIPNAAASDATYHVRATRTAGEPGVDSGTLGSWLLVSGSPEWIITDSVDKFITLTIAISNNGGSTTIDSASYSLNLIGG